MLTTRNKSSKKVSEKFKEIKDKKKRMKHKIIPDEPLPIPILEKKHTPTHNKNPTSLITTLKTVKSTAQINPTTSPTTNTPHIEVTDYCTALENTISVPIVNPSKHSTFLLQKQ